MQFLEINFSEASILNQIFWNFIKILQLKNVKKIPKKYDKIPPNMYTYFLKALNKLCNRFL